jgi:hypothetical protein
VKHILKSVVFILAAVYFIVDAIFLTIVPPLTRWLARKESLFGCGSGSAR